MKNKILIFFAGLIVLASLATAFHANAYKYKPAEIYVPCGMIVPFKEAISAFKNHNPGVKLEPNFDNGAILVRMVLDKNKRPDLFVSPGEIEMRNLSDRGIIDNDTVTRLGEFNLVLYTSSSNPAQIKDLKDLTKPEVKVIALADPRFNSVGTYAKETLEKSGIWKDVEERIVYTDSPIQALTLVASGKAQAGIHYDTCPFDTAPEKISAETLKIIQKLPHQAVSAQIAVLKEAKNKKLALEFIRFLSGERGQKILNNAGIKCLPQATIGTTPPKVSIMAYYPLNEEHQFVANYLKSMEKKYPGKVTVKVIDFRTSDGYDAWRKTGLACAGVFINAKSEFELETPEGKKKVKFLRRLDTFWSREDFEKVLENEIKK
ncbi:MAG: molybdate ABC transporter substrate-binding protein [Candidatus Omnitrophica bacterium]|nr:molybdate ABC transporter substrate-binding protein [Candidatus Omnitrophota bacterium]